MITIVSAIWQREKLTEIFLQSLERYRKDYGITAMVAGSEGSKTKEMCSGVGYIETPNKPISNKFIRASQEAIVRYKPTHLLILGSDDFIDDSLIKKYIEHMTYDVVGVRDCYFYHTGSREGMHWHGYNNFREGEPIGMARMLSRKVYERLKGKIWPAGMNSGLDYTMMQRLKKVRDLKRITFEIKDTGMAVDIKGQGNISGFDCYRGNMTEVEDSAFDTIPEFSLIQKL